MGTNQTGILIAQGILPNTTELTEFFKALQESELSAHQAGKPFINFKNDGICVTLYIKGVADFLFRSSFKNGVLKHWENEFKMAESA
ncbi:MAG: hypothetical protein AAB628_02865 [Patescibacteria group bacterium]